MTLLKGFDVPISLGQYRTQISLIFIFILLHKNLFAMKITSESNFTIPSYYGYQYGSSGNDYSSSIFTDSAGNVYVTGNTNQSLFNSIPPDNAGGRGLQDIFISKHHSSNGSLMWGFQFGSSLPESGIDLSSNNINSGDIFVTGFTTGKLFEKMNETATTTLWYITYKNQHKEDITLCPGEKFIASGCSYYWGSTSSSTSPPPSFSLLDDHELEIARSSNNCSGGILQYNYQNTASCSSFSLLFGCASSSKCTATVALIIFSNATNYNETLVDPFLTRLDSTTGEVLWGKQFGTTSIDIPSAIDVSPWDGSVYVVGSTQGSLFSSHRGGDDVFVGKFNSTNGELIWGYQNGTNGRDYASSLACDVDGAVYVLGYSCCSPYFPSPNSSSLPKSRSIITMKFSSNGTLLWGRQYGRRGADNFGLSIAIGQDNSIFVSGHSFNPNYSTYSSALLFKFNSLTGEKIWKITESLKYGWAISVLNSSVYVSSTVLRNMKNKYQLTKYDGNNGRKVWSIKYAAIPRNYISTSSYRASVSINQNNLLRVSASVSGDVYGSYSGGVDIIILSPNICPAGYYSIDPAFPCDICPSNTFSSEGAQSCTSCPHGFTSTAGSSSCEECYGGYFDDDHSICFHTDQHLLYYLFFLIVPVYLLTMLLLSLSWMNVGFAYTSILSTFDFLSDILYITTTFFYSFPLFYCSIILLFPAFVPLIYDLCHKIYDNKNTLRIFEPPINFLSQFQKYSLSWWVVAVLSVVVWSCLLIPYVIITLFFGYYLMQTKFLSLPYYERLWHTLYFSNPFSSSSSSSSSTKNTTLTKQSHHQMDLNLSLLNKALLTEIWFEAIPQIIVQSLNNIRMNSFGFIPQMSLTASILIIVNTYYRIFYFNILHGIPLSDIPVPMKTPLSPFFTLKSKIENHYSHHDDHKTHDENNDIDHTSNTQQLDTQSSSLTLLQQTHSIQTIHSSSPSPQPILIHFPIGSTGIVFKTHFIQKDNVKYEDLRVFYISPSSLSYLSGLRRGYVVHSINGIQYSNSHIKLSSNYCPRECDILFSPPSPSFTTTQLEIQGKIKGFDEIGMQVAIKRSCYGDVSYYEVTHVVKDSLADQRGVRAGYRIMSVNENIFQEEMKKELFLNQDNQLMNLKTENSWFPSLSFLFQQQTKQNQIQNQTEKPLKIIFKTPTRSSSSSSSSSTSSFSSWIDEWSLDQVILNNHLRAINLLLFTFKNGVPYLGKIPFFFTDTLENFGTFSLYLMTWVLVILIQLLWFFLWILFYFMKLPFQLPWILRHSILHFSFPIEFDLLQVLIVVGYDFFFSFLYSYYYYIVYRSSYYSISLKGIISFWISIPLFLFVISIVGGFVFHRHYRLFQLYRGFLISLSVFFTVVTISDGFSWNHVYLLNPYLLTIVSVLCVGILLFGITKRCPALFVIAFSFFSCNNRVSPIS